MTETEDKLVLAVLNTINDRLGRIERWTEGHDGDHRHRAELRAEEMVEYENRLTRLESNINIKTVAGALIAIVYAIMEVTRQAGLIR